MFSHHDLLVSTCSIPPLQHDMSNNVIAPRIPNVRFTTKWSEEGVTEYSQVVTSLLPQIKDTWGSTLSTANISHLLSTTFAAMNLAAQATNKVTMLGNKYKKKHMSNTSATAAAMASLQELHHLRSLEASPLSTIADLEEANQRLFNCRYLDSYMVELYDHGWSAVCWPGQVSQGKPCSISQSIVCLWCLCPPLRTGKPCPLHQGEEDHWSTLQRTSPEATQAPPGNPCSCWLVVFLYQLSYTSECSHCLVSCAS
jgi:hypothetical protein